MADILNNIKVKTFFLAAVICLIFGSATQSSGQVWRNIAVAPEHRCSEYDRKRDYTYPQSLENKIINTLGGKIYGPYTGRTFASKKQTDIEHIVAMSEAHDSGLCNADRQTRKRFARDILNLTLAAPEVNRCGRNGKCGKDAAEWLPDRNQCWFAKRVIEIRTKYKLTIDVAEARTLERVLSGCTSTNMVYYEDRRQMRQQTNIIRVNQNALSLYDDNRDGRITCREARRHGIDPVYKSHPAYAFMHDGDNDGMVCE